jgi:hypothetical protein
MNGAQWHLILNHFPFIGSAFSAVVLSLGYFFKNQKVKETGLILVILTALITIPVLLTGEPAEDVLEAIGKKNSALIHKHEEAAETSFWLMEFSGLLGLLTLIAFYRNKNYARSLLALSFVTVLITAGFMMNVNNLGGKIRHSEIRETGVYETEK